MGSRRKPGDVTDVTPEVTTKFLGAVIGGIAGAGEDPLGVDFSLSVPTDISVGNGGGGIEVSFTKPPTADAVEIVVFDAATGLVVAKDDAATSPGVVKVPGPPRRQYKVRVRSVAGSRVGPYSAEYGVEVLPPVTSGLVVWYRADAIDLLDGSLVASWSDASGNGRHASASGTARPTYVASGLNGRPVVRADGIDDFMTFSLGVLSEATIAAVVVDRNPLAGVAFVEKRQSIRAIHTPTTPRWRYEVVITASPWTSKAVIGSVVVANDPMLYVGVHSVASGTVKLFLNGGSHGTATGLTGVNPGLEWQLFRRDTAPGPFDIAELLIYDRALTDAERQKVERHLGAFWGIAVS